MPYVRRLAISVTWAALTLLSTAALAAVVQNPVATLLPSNSTTLPFSPSKMSLSDDTIVLIGRIDRKRGRITKLDAGSLKTMANAELEFVPRDVVVRKDGKSIFVVGHDDGKDMLYVFDENLSIVSRLPLKRLSNYPALSLNKDGILIVGGLWDEKSIGAVSFYDVSDPTSPRRDGRFRVTSTRGGETEVRMDSVGKIAFLNAAAEPALLAVDARSDKIVRRIRYSSKSRRGDMPFTVFILSRDMACWRKDSSSIIISDTQFDRIMLVEYDPIFQSFDIKTNVDVRLRIVPGTKTEYFEGTGFIKPPGLLASSCDQSVVWLGSIYSNEIAQYSVNTAISSLERVGALKLPTRPSALAVSENGQFAIVLSTIDKSVRRYDRDLNNVGNRIIGDPMVRQLQRILAKKGYPVGSIDGILGKQTLRAVKLYEEKNNVRLDVYKDLKASVKTVGGEL